MDHTEAYSRLVAMRKMIYSPPLILAPKDIEAIMLCIDNIMECVPYNDKVFCISSYDLVKNAIRG